MEEKVMQKGIEPEYWHNAVLSIEDGMIKILFVCHGNILAKLRKA